MTPILLKLLLFFNINMILVLSTGMKACMRPMLEDRNVHCFQWYPVQASLT